MSGVAPKKVEEDLKKLPFVRNIKIEENKLDLRLTNAEQQGLSVMAYLVSEKVPVLRYEILEPSLENVFMEVIQ